MNAFKFSQSKKKEQKERKLRKGRPVETEETDGPDGNPKRQDSHRALQNPSGFAQFHTGPTTINAGTISITANERISDISAFNIAGGKLQLWIDEGKVWRKPRNGFSRLLSYDEEPFSYVTEIGFYILVMLSGLLFVWLALGGGFGRFTRK